MFRINFLLLFHAVCLVLAKPEARETGQSARKLPDGLLLGAATASYQVEGAWNEDGKSENIWDHLAHKVPCAIKECHTGDIADNSYHMVERDVEMMRELGLDFYRFSLSWTRILPTSFPDQINEAGVQYYNNLINEMLKYNIEPMVTILYHWDLPHKLQLLGGWTNPQIVDWFTDYARIVFELFGDRVKYWITVNEPHSFCYLGYAEASMAPLYNISGMAEYMCAKNLLVAHAKTWHMYNDKCRSRYGGSIGITIGAAWYEPSSEKDVEAAEDFHQFEFGQYAHPIFSADGDFPPIMKNKIAAKSAQQGFPRSRLPELTKDEIELIKGTSDFFGLNHYSSTIVVPWGFYKLLTKIRKDYGNPPIFVTENGYASDTGLQDDRRVAYYRSYLEAMLDAIEEGSDVRAYTAWSLMDNFEWLQGYTDRFGLYEVDYDSPERTRTPRASAYVYKEILRTRTIDYNYTPDMSVPLSVD